MTKKDFSSIKTGRIYDTLEAATADPDKQERKERRTYTEEEAAAAMLEMRTAGRKGVKLPRVNMAFAPDVYTYIKTMAKVRGETLTEFVNVVMRKSMNDNQEIYQKAIEFKNSFK